MCQPSVDINKIEGVLEEAKEHMEYHVAQAKWWEEKIKDLQAILDTNNGGKWKMSIIGKIFKVVIDVVELPIEVTKDIFTLGGTATIKDTPYTADKLKELKKDLTDF